MELVNDQLGLLAALVGILYHLVGSAAGRSDCRYGGSDNHHNKRSLFRDNLSFLLGRSPGPEFLGRVEQLALAVEGVLEVRELRAEYVGPDIVHAGLHLVVPRGLPVEDAHRIAETVRARVHEETDGHPGRASGGEHVNKAEMSAPRQHPHNDCRGQPENRLEH